MNRKNLTMLICGSLLALSPTVFAEVTQTIEKTFTLSKNASIRLDNVNGDVTVKACQCDQASVTAEIRASSQEMMDRIQVKMDSNDNQLTISTKYQDNRGSSWNNQSSEVIYHLVVPANSRLADFDLVNGDLTVEGVEGGIDADLVNGQLKSDGLSADTRVNMVNGDIELRFKDLSKAQSIELESVNGEINVYLPSNPDISVSASTVSGRITNDFGINVNKHQYVGSDMNGSLGDGRVRIKMSNVNGRISLKSS